MKPEFESQFAVLLHFKMRGVIGNSTKSGVEKFLEVRVVILNPGPGRYFVKLFDVFRKSEYVIAPFFWKRHEINRVHQKK